MAERVLTDVADGVMVITINRPERRNAVDLATARELAAALDDLDARDDVAVGVLTGAGGTFCAGMDLAAFATGERRAIPGRGFAGITERPPATPLIAAVEGWALAGGFEIVLSADLVVAARTAKFGLTEVRRGLVAAAGGLLRLPKSVPYQVAMRIALTGEPISAEEAAVHGLVVELTDEGGALAAARALAARIAHNAPLALRATKRIMSEAAGWTDTEAFARQRVIADPIFSSEDAHEGAVAFTEKRDPVWRGR